MHPAKSHFENALMLLQAGKRAEAMDALTDVLKADGTHAEAWAIRGDMEHGAGRNFNALLHYNGAVKYAPEKYQYWCNRGLVASAIGLVALAKDDYAKSISLQDNLESRINLGHLHGSMLEVDEAAASYEAALKLVPNDAQALSNLGQVQLSQGKFHEGWNNYRHRFNNPHFPPRPRIDFPWWRGEPIEGKTILLFAEQGHGDEIMSLRFAHNVKKLGARVIVSVRPQMFRLARSLYANPHYGCVADAVIIQYDTPPWPVDYCCALLDVPAFTGVTAATMPCKDGYLRSVRDGILDLPEGFKVGICWETGKRPLQPATESMQKAKTIALERLSALHRPGVVLVSLQQSHDSHATMEKWNVINPMAGVQDFDDTAWIISQLDLVVTVDTSVAHLAGALGKPVWNLVRYDAIWPWMKETRETCWYDSMTVYRQPAHHNWQEPIGRLSADFHALLARRDQARVA